MISAGEDERQELKPMFLPGDIDRFRQPLSPLVVDQQLQAVEAGKRQFMKIARLVIMLDELAVFAIGIHGKTSSACQPSLA
jgi:hypothetical protein